jgi:PIN domain nuclease of toxin-antitoxin system
MKLLFDTHLLLWIVQNSPRLPRAAITLIDDTENDLLFSAVSLWEYTIKYQLSRDDMGVNPRLLRRSLLDNGYTEVHITSEHTVAIDALPPIHRDPFDRLLVAQATVEGITLLTVDKVLARYPGPVRKV